MNPQSGFTPIVGQWYHLAGVYDAVAHSATLYVNGLLADQLCATPYQPLEEKSLAAASGRLVQARGRCQTHIPLFGP